MGNPISGQQKDFRPGQLIRADQINRINDDGAQGVGIFPSPFGYGGRFPGGTVFVPSPTRSASGSMAATIYPPWFPFLTTTGAGAVQGNFFQGTVGGILPTGLTGIALTAGDVNYVYLACTATNGVLTGATLTVSTTYPTLAAAASGSPPTSFNIPIAIFDLSQSPNVATNLVGFGNIWAQPYVTILDTINTGALLTAPFTPWFNWEWGASVA